MSVVKTIKRSELYRLVWQEPMSRLAKTYGMSDVGLAKVCRKHDIPCPPRGYWARKQHGQQPEQTPLPDPERTTQIELRDPADVTVTPTAEAPALDVNVEVADSLRGCHALVSTANQELQHAATGESGLIRHEDERTLHVVTSKASLRRALLIMDALLKALENLGHTVGRGPTVMIDGLALRFGIVEDLEKKREVPAEHDLDGSYSFGHSRYDEKRVPSGRLALSIDHSDSYWLHGCRRTWRDTERHRLEDRLDRFIAGLLAMVACRKQYEVEQAKRMEQRRLEEERRQEAARQLAEKRKQYKAEAARVNELITEAENWRKARLLREFVETVKREHTAAGTFQPGSPIEQWAEWASRQADRLDPLRPSPPSILDEDLPAEEPPQMYRRF